MADLKLSDPTVAVAVSVGVADLLYLVQGGATKSVTPPVLFGGGATPTGKVPAYTAAGLLAPSAVTEAGGVLTVAEVLTAASTTTEHTATLNAAPSATANHVRSVRHLNIGGISGERYLDAATGEQRGRVGYGNAAGTIFTGYLFDDAGNIDGGQPPGRALIQSGVYKGTFHNRARLRFLSVTGELEVRDAEQSSETGAVMLGSDRFGSVFPGIGGLATTAPGGFLGLPHVNGAPTGEPLYRAGYSQVKYDPVNHSLWVWEPDATKALPLPNWYLALDESLAGATGDEVLYSPTAFFTAQGPGGSPQTPGVTGSGYCRRFSSGSALQLAASTATDVGVSFLLSIWVRPQTALAAAKLYNKTGLVSLATDSSGRVTADFGGGATTIPGAAATQLSLNVWSHVLFWRDDAAKTLNLQVGGGTIQSASYSGTPPTSISAVTGLGFTGSASTSYFVGDVDEVAFFQDTCLDSNLRSSLYNSGTARPFRWTTGWAAPVGGGGVWQTLGGSMSFTSTVSFTRPTNTTAYGAGDVIGINNAGSAGSAIHEFDDAGPEGGHVLITDVSLEIDLTAVPSGMTSFRLYLYDASPDAILDNAVWDLSSAGDRGKFLGFIDVGSPVDLGSTLYVEQTGVNKKVKLADGATSLYGVLVTAGAYTPASGTAFVVRLNAVGV